MTTRGPVENPAYSDGFSVRRFMQIEEGPDPDAEIGIVLVVRYTLAAHPDTPRELELILNRAELQTLSEALEVARNALDGIWPGE